MWRTCTSQTLVAVFAALVVGGCAANDTSRPRPRSHATTSEDGLEWSPAVVDSVTDGDTIRLRGGDRVRLVQVDTPEVHDRPQCWGEEASEALRDRLPAGTEVELAGDRRLDDVDQHGRLLRYVALDGEVLNVWLVHEGHALPYFFHGDRGTYADELLDDARDARTAKRGMWGACAGVRLDPGIGL